MHHLQVSYPHPEITGSRLESGWCKIPAKPLTEGGSIRYHAKPVGEQLRKLALDPDLPDTCETLRCVSLDLSGRGTTTATSTMYQPAIVS